MELVLPIALTYAVVGFTLLNWRLAGVIDWAGVGAAVALSLLLVARQGVIGGQSEMRQYAALVNASADMAFVCQADGLLRLSNPAAAAVLRVDTPPASLEEFLATPKPSRAFLQSAVDGGWSGEVELRRGDGTLFPASLSLRPVWDERLGRPLLVGTAHDLTYIREREDDLRAALSQVAVARSDLETLNTVLEHRVSERTRELAEFVERLHRMNLELQELGRLKSEFVTLVSHELRAPLTNISHRRRADVGRQSGSRRRGARAIDARGGGNRTAGEVRGDDPRPFGAGSGAVPAASRAGGSGPGGGAGRRAPGCSTPGDRECGSSCRTPSRRSRPTSGRSRASSFTCSTTP